MPHGAFARGLQSAGRQGQAVCGAGVHVKVNHGNPNVGGRGGRRGLFTAVPGGQHHDFEANGVHAEFAVVGGSLRDVVQTDRQVCEFAPRPVGRIVQADAVGLSVHVIDATARV